MLSCLRRGQQEVQSNRLTIWLFISVHSFHQYAINSNYVTFVRHKDSYRRHIYIFQDPTLWGATVTVTSEVRTTHIGIIGRRKWKRIGNGEVTLATRCLYQVPSKSVFCFEKHWGQTYKRDSKYSYHWPSNGNCKIIWKGNILVVV
jgi:hypothetical protein